MSKLVLPFEVIDIILSFCDYKSAARLGQTCRTANALYKRQKKKLDDKISNSKFERYLQYTLNMNLYDLKSFLKCNKYAILGEIIFKCFLAEQFKNLDYISGHKPSRYTSTRVLNKVKLVSLGNYKLEKNDYNFINQLDSLQHTDTVQNELCGIMYDGEGVGCNISPIIFGDTIYRRYTGSKYDKYLLNVGYKFDDYSVTIQKYLGNRVLVHKRDQYTFTAVMNKLCKNLDESARNKQRNVVRDKYANTDYKYKLKLYKKLSLIPEYYTNYEIDIFCRGLFYYGIPDAILNPVSIIFSVIDFSALYPPLILETNTLPYNVLPSLSGRPAPRNINHLSN